MHKSKKALHKMDISVPSRSLLAIMGPSGCGKSTLLKSLNGESPPTKGRVLIFNQDYPMLIDLLRRSFFLHFGVMELGLGGVRTG